MTKYFDGKKRASELEEELKKEVDKLNIKPLLTSIVVGDYGGAVKYQSLKEKKAQRIGAEIDIMKFNEDINLEKLIGLVKKLNNDDSIHGIMVQLPLPDKFSDEDRDKLISTIDPDMDVDGMKMGGIFVTPVVKATLVAIKEAVDCLPTDREAKVVIVGSHGFVGSRMKKTLEDMGYRVEGADSKTENLSELTRSADILISATGVHHLIEGRMVKEGAIVIDIGAPKSDVDKVSLEGKVCFISPVPGGVGPMTISCLLENLVESCIQKQ